MHSIAFNTWKFPTQVQSKAYECNLSAQNARVKDAMDKLDEFKPVLGRLGSASDGLEMSVEIGKTISVVNHPWKTCMPVIWLKAAKSYSKHGDFLYWCCIQGGLPSALDANHMTDEIVASQDARRISWVDEKSRRKHPNPGRPALQTPGNSELGQTPPGNKWLFQHNGRSNGFHSQVARQLDTYVRLMWDRFITDSSVLGHYIFVAAEKNKAVELQNKIDNFKDRLMRELMIDMRFKQGLVFVSETDCPTFLIRGIRFHSGRCEVCACRCCKSRRWVVCDPCLTFLK